MNAWRSDVFMVNVCCTSFSLLCIYNCIAHRQVKGLHVSGVVQHSFLRLRSLLDSEYRKEEEKRTVYLRIYISTMYSAAKSMLLVKYESSSDRPQQNQTLFFLHQQVICCTEIIHHVKHSTFIWGLKYWRLFSHSKRPLTASVIIMRRYSRVDVTMIDYSGG